MPSPRRRGRSLRELMPEEEFELALGPDPRRGSIFPDHEARLVATDKYRALQAEWDTLARWQAAGRYHDEEARRYRAAYGDLPRDPQYPAIVVTDWCEQRCNIAAGYRPTHIGGIE